MNNLLEENTIIIGAGPCGLSTALALKAKGVSPLILEKGNVVNTIYQFPTHQTFFSSSDKLEIGDIPFVSDRQSPVRSEALAYYRTVAARENLRINAFEAVFDIEKRASDFYIKSKNELGQIKVYRARHIIIATGYYDQPKHMNIPGENLPKVSHYFKEAHPYYKQNVVIIGCKNSAVDAALELHKVGANITVIYRGKNYPDAIKPWILPRFKALIEKDIIQMIFEAEVEEITEDTVYYKQHDKSKAIQNDFVFAMTGYLPDLNLLKNLQVTVDEKTHIPYFNPDTMETNVSGVYIAGVVAAGFRNNAIFIENGKLHGEKIANSICKRECVK